MAEPAETLAGLHPLRPPDASLIDVAADALIGLGLGLGLAALGLALALWLSRAVRNAPGPPPTPGAAPARDHARFRRPDPSATTGVA